MSDRPTGEVSSADGPDTSESLPVLVGRLGDELTELVDSKLSLLKIELQEDVRWYGRNAAGAIGGGVIAAVGGGLLSVAAAFFVSTLLREAADVGPAVASSLGFASVGLLCLIAGAMVGVPAARRLAAGEQTEEGAATNPARRRQSLRPGSV